MKRISRTRQWLMDNRDHDGAECLFSPFKSTQQGYVGTVFSGEFVYLHRWMCQERHGPPPSPKHQASHSCGRGADGCVNPAHLSWKTPSENQADRKTVGTPFTGRRRKLAPHMIEEICAGNSPPQLLAKKFGVTEARIRQVRSAHSSAMGK
jgi:hypothetical protein